MTLAVGEQGLEARFGVARLGAFRLGAFTFILIAKINGAQIESVRLMRGTKITHTLGQPSSAVLRVRPQTGASAIVGRAVVGVAVLGGGVVIPRSGQEVTIAFGGDNVREFGGHITQVKEVSLATHEFAYDLVCTDYTYKLNKRTVNWTAGSMLSSVMAQSIINNWTDPADAITFNALGAGNTIAGLAFRNMKPGAALNRIAKQDGASYRLGPNKQVRWWYGAEPGVQNPSAIIVGTTSYEAINWKPSDTRQIKTRIRVEGLGSVLSAPVSAGGTSAAFDDASWASAAGGSIMLGTDEVTYTGKSGNTLTGIPASGAGSIQNAWGAGTDGALLVIVNDTGAQAVLVAIEGGDGIHEGDPIIDNGLSITGATERGQAELNTYAAIHSFGDIVRSVDRFMQVGRQIQINLPYRNINGTFLIQQVTISFRGVHRPVRDVLLGVHRTDLVDLLINQTSSAGQVG